MLRGGNPLTVGVGIIIEVIRKNNSDYDPDVGAGAESAPSSRDPIYLGTLLRMFAHHVPDFMTLILSPTYNVLNEDGTTTVKKRELKAAFGETIEPLGFDRFKTCELMAELLHCSNMGLLNERGSEKFVKERDGERERLKAEGTLSVGKEGHSETDFTEDSTTYQPAHSPSALGSESPEEVRKLEVANGGEEDGFEDVAASGVLNDEVKDDFDEKPEMEDETTSKAATAGTGSEEKPGDEDDFVDEPLSSPRPLSVRPQPTKTEEGEKGATRRSSLGQEPLSPTSAGVTAQIGSIGLDRDHDTIMSASADTEPTAEREQGKIIQQEVSVSGSANATVLDGVPQSPISNVMGEIAREQSKRTGQPAESIPEKLPAVALSPHPEDQPAPLFAARSTDEKAMDRSQTDEHGIIRGPSQETIDTTGAEEGDSSRPILMAGPDVPPEPQIETDVDGSPVVGDFLKMMFVEHRVVPTILVS